MMKEIHAPEDMSSPQFIKDLLSSPDVVNLQQQVLFGFLLKLNTEQDNFPEFSAYLIFKSQGNVITTLNACKKLICPIAEAFDLITYQNFKNNFVYADY